MLAKIGSGLHACLVKILLRVIVVEKEEQATIHPSVHPSIDLVVTFEFDEQKNRPKEQNRFSKFQQWLSIQVLLLLSD